MTVTPYNFLKPSPLAAGLEPHAAGWWRRACALANDNWSRTLPFSLQIRYDIAELATAGETLGQLPDQAVGYPLTVRENLTTVMIWPRPLMLAIVLGLLGDTPDKLPGDRALTPIEDSLFDYFLKDLLLKSWLETWQGPGSCPMLLGTMETNPRWAKWYPPAETLAVATFRLTGPFGEHGWQWLFPRKTLVEQFVNSQTQPAASSEALPKRLQELVHELPMELRVVLGSAELSLSQLSGLRCGDVVMLNQRVAHPMNAYLGEKKVMAGWPGRVGNRQAWQIQSLAEPGA